MKKEVIQGIPFWLDTQNRIYAFEGKEVPSSPLWLGTYNPSTQKVDLRADWQAAYAERLEEYRRKTTPRPRVPTSTS